VCRLKAERLAERLADHLIQICTPCLTRRSSHFAVVNNKRSVNRACDKASLHQVATCTCIEQPKNFSFLQPYTITSQSSCVLVRYAPTYANNRAVATSVNSGRHPAEFIEPPRYSWQRVVIPHKGDILELRYNPRAARYSWQSHSINPCHRLYTSEL
jgi:hypothetical protein